MMKIGSAVILAATLCLTGCATPYGSTSLAGGHSDAKVNDRLIKVDFFGNGFITSDKVQTYGLYRCAEIADAAKKPYFVVYDSLNAAALNRPSNKPRVGTLGNKPVAVAFVLLEDAPRIGAQKTSAVLAELGPIVRGDANNQKEPQ
jgi:hypothetical protein